MRSHKKTHSILKTSALAVLSASAAFAATTPYDLIRPTWPLTWDEKAMDNFDTTITKKTGMLPTPRVPASFKAGALMSDTLDQAYLDVINTKIASIRVNQAGYLKSDKERQFHYVGSANEFEVVDENGKSLSTKLTGTFTATTAKVSSDWTIVAGTNSVTNDQMRYQVDFTGASGTIKIGQIPQSVPTDTRLRIKVGDEVSSTFIVSEDVYTMVKDATLKFFGIQRSGDSKSWFHGPSHTKDGAGAEVDDAEDVRDQYNEALAGSLQGGWYDCGDFLKESHTQMFSFMALAVMAATNPTKDVDHYDYNQANFTSTDGIPDVLREAKHGADFVLRAYNRANGIIDDMALSVGNFGPDHGFWGRPEVSDMMPIDGSASATDRGGPMSRTVRLGEIGSNIGGETAAGLAILGKLYAKYDKDFADSCLTVAEKMYDFAKSLAQGKSSYDDGKKFVHNKHAAGWGSPAYNGNNEYTDDMALASVALLYATGKETYLNDALRAKDLADLSSSDCAGCFKGGWFAAEHGSFTKNQKNTSWANSHTYALYALYKLILADKEKAAAFGLTEEERLSAIEDCVANMIVNLGDMGTSDGSSISLPTTGLGWKSTTVRYNPTWYSMSTDFSWLFNHYQLGNIFDVMAYADVAAGITLYGDKLPTMGSANLKTTEMLQLGINQLNYMLGVNPWDISFVYGVGDKNDNHPHHRASNPEGRNTPSWSYKYVRPVGAIYGGAAPSEENTLVPTSKSWEDYHLSEVSLSASAVMLSALTIASNGGSDYYEKKCNNCDTTDATPFAANNAYVTTYRYTYGGLDFFDLKILNESTNALDSVTAYIYYEATEDDVKSCAATFDTDICMVYDAAGFSKPCTFDNELRTQLRKASFNPEKVENTYDEKTKTYTWALPINLGAIDLGQSIRMDIGVTAGLAANGSCETMASPSKIKMQDAWSFTAHAADKASKGAPAYAGAPDWDKDAGDIQEAPEAPYIVLRSKGKLLWGYGPAATTDDRTGVIQVAPQVAGARMAVNGRTLYAQAPAQGNKTVKIFDLLGNQLMAQSFSGTSAQVSLAKLPRRGTMIAKLMQNDKVLATKAIKVK